MQRAIEVAAIGAITPIPLRALLIKDGERQMRKRRLGRTGLMVSEIGLGGAWLLGRHAQQSVDTGAALVHHALALGISYIDTAECYIDGRSEAVVGQALDSHGGDCVVATKFGHRPQGFDFTRAGVMASIQESRRLLRGRIIDVIQVHTPDVPDWARLFGRDGAITGMRDAQERGWCRYLGITGLDLEFLRRCIDTDIFDTALIFLRYDLLDQRAEALFSEARAHDMGVILGSPLRMGLLGSAVQEMLGHATDDERRQMKALAALFAAEPHGVVGGAIQFALAPSDVSVVLSGVSSPEDIDAVAAAARTPLRPELAAAVRRIAAHE